jgi:hypothetical protein
VGLCVERVLLRGWFYFMVVIAKRGASLGALLSAADEPSQTHTTHQNAANDITRAQPAALFYSWLRSLYESTLFQTSAQMCELHASQKKLRRFWNLLKNLIWQLFLVDFSSSLVYLVWDLFF